MAHPDREHVYRVRDEPNGSQPANATAAAAAASYFRRNSFATIHPPPDHPADDGHHHTHHHHLLGLHEYRARRRSSAFSMDDADTLQGTSNATQAYDTANTSPQGPRLGADEEIGAHAGTITHDRAFGDVVAVVDDDRVSPPLPPLDFDELAARRRSSVFVGGTSAGPPALTLRTSTFRRQSRVHSIAHADGDDPNLVDLHSVLSTPCHAGAARRVSAPSSTSYAAWGALLAGCANPSFGHSVSNQHANTYNHQQQPSQQPQPGSGASVGSGNVPRGLASVDSAAALAAASLLRSPVIPVGPSFTPSSESLLGAGASGSVRAGMFSPGSPARAAARRTSELSAFELQPDTESTTDDGPAAAGMSASVDLDFTPAALKTIRETTEDKRASAACELAFAKRLLEYLVSPAATAWYMAGIDPLAHVVRLYHVHRDRDARETRIAMELLPGTTVRDVPEVAAHRRRVHVAAAADPASPLVRTSSVVAVQLTTQPVCVGSAIAAARARSQKNPAAAEDGAHDADGSPPRALLQPTTDLHEGGGGSGHSSLTSNRPSLLSGSLHTVTAAATTTTTTTATTDGARTGTNATIETATTTTVSLTHTGGADSPLIAPLPNPPHPSANSADDEEERFVVFHRRPSAPAMSQETPRALARLRLARDVALTVCCSASLDAALRDVARDALEGLRFLHDELRVVHRDIKPSNLLLDHDGRVKIADFGVSAVLDPAADPTASLTGQAGSISYMAPERVRGDPNGTPGDVWALGITLLELATGEHPLQPALRRRPSASGGGTTSAARFWAVASALGALDAADQCAQRVQDLLENALAAPGSPFDASSPFALFVARCLTADPAARPSARELLADPWLARPTR